MKKRLVPFRGISCLALVLLALPRPAGAVTLGFKLFGGYNSMNGGDVNEGLKGWFDVYKTEAILSGASVDGDYQAFHAGLVAGADLIVYLSPVIGIGLGASYLQTQSNSEMSVAFGPLSGSLTIKPQISAIPVRVGLHVALPLGSLLNLTLNAGAEYYLAKIKNTLRVDMTAHWNQSAFDVDSKGKIGFCGGLGLEIRIHPNFSVILEGGGRYARLDKFEGKATATSSTDPPATLNGKLWYAEFVPAPGYRFPLLDISNSGPALSPAIANARYARLDINGFSALAGIMLRF